MCGTSAVLVSVLRFCIFCFWLLGEFSRAAGGEQKGVCVRGGGDSGIIILYFGGG